MSPTVFRERGFRFYFFSTEKSRKHVHVHGADGEAKFWLEPEVELARSHGLSERQLVKIRTLVEERCNELTNAWDSFFGD